MDLNQEGLIDFSKIRKLGVLPVQLEGDIYTTPFSQLACVWYEWIHSPNEHHPDKGYTFGEKTARDQHIWVKNTIGDLTTYPDRVMLYIAPSFNDLAILDGKEVTIAEYCLKPKQTYYAFAEKFTYRLPSFHFLPFIPRRKPTWLLALSDEQLDKERLLHPLIPERQRAEQFVLSVHA